MVSMNWARRCSLLGLGAVVAALAAAGPAPAQGEQPVKLYAPNSRYLEYRGKPVVLVTSAEHYGAVLNRDFDFVPYLDELKARGFNLTRIFSGAYVEPPGAFKIQGNTLAPAGERFICPWARSETPGYAGGGKKFDLSRWDPAYFARLKEFCRQAERRGIIVELVMFCPYYDDGTWDRSPLKASNNINGIGDIPREKANTLDNGVLLDVQLAMVRKIVSELREVRNLFYELCNEPYFAGVTLDWQYRVAETIRDAEKGFPRRHLIAQNIANKTKKVDAPHPAVSIFNFHYASPPTAVYDNYGLNRVIGFDETGFRGTADLPYRTDGWEFLLAGGGLYNHLDYSFTAEHPDGSAPVVPPTPGGGGPGLRSQLQVLKRFVEGLEFARMRPAQELVVGGVPNRGAVRVLAEHGRSYAAYVRGGNQTELALVLPPGLYQVEWVSTATGEAVRSGTLEHAGGTARLASPNYAADIALRLRR